MSVRVERELKGMKKSPMPVTTWCRYPEKADAAGPGPVVMTDPPRPRIRRDEPVPGLSPGDSVALKLVVTAYGTCRVVAVDRDGAFLGEIWPPPLIDEQFVISLEHTARFVGQTEVGAEVEVEDCSQRPEGTRTVTVPIGNEGQTIRYRVARSKPEWRPVAGDAVLLRIASGSWGTTHWELASPEGQWLANVLDGGPGSPAPGLPAERARVVRTLRDGDSKLVELDLELSGECEVYRDPEIGEVMQSGRHM